MCREKRRSWLPVKGGLGYAQKATGEGLFVELVMPAQLGGYRVGHGLAATDHLSGLTPVNRGVPTRIRVLAVRPLVA
jgi:hypothetical protein